MSASVAEHSIQEKSPDAQVQQQPRNTQLSHHDYVYVKAQIHSTSARQLVFANGIINFLFGLSVMFMPQIFHDGKVARFISRVSGLASPIWETNPSSAFDVAILMMGFAFAAVTAGQSDSNDAYRSVAALNGASGIAGLLTCILSPHTYGSTFLLFTSVQNLLWYALIVHVGEFGHMDCLGLSTRGLYVIEERLARDVLKHIPHPGQHFMQHHGREKAAGN
ncbi:hypothetical protein D9613_011201 [Agrocybe pediades]|uniref:Uncharacterized protein n=1 Tax=Agrocybe pediades TaxID=84607 RepID=A0A8H4VJL4_9AGAR|nr:hypothetical protein D9613_011201 [Agrocybe pediades]